MGVAEEWQNELIARYPEDVLFLNPRRTDWNKDWDHDSPQFDEQVMWENQMLDHADLIVMYFDPNTKSPISLLELGLYADSRKLIVCCPDGYWRQGNVRIICELYNIPYYTDKQEWLAAIDKRIKPERRYTIDQVRSYVEGWLGSDSDMDSLSINQITAMLQNSLTSVADSSDGIENYVDRQEFITNANNR